MSILYIFVPLAILISLGFLIAFFWAVRSGQFEDLDSPAHKVVLDEFQTSITTKGKNNESAE